MGISSNFVNTGSVLQFLIGHIPEKLAHIFSHVKKWLYKSLCRSVRPSVRPSVCLLDNFSSNLKKLLMWVTPFLLMSVGLPVTFLSVSHTFVCWSHFCLLVTLLSVSHTFVLGWVEGPPYFFFLLSYGCHKTAKHLWLAQRTSHNFMWLKMCPKGALV